MKKGLPLSVLDMLQPAGKGSSSSSTWSLVNVELEDEDDMD